MIVKQILAMKSGPDEIVTIRPDTTVAEAARLLSERRIGAVVVSSDGRKAEGILSERDIVRELGRSGAEVLERTASEMMTRKVSTCVCADDALEVLERMTQGRFRHLPVVDDKGEMLGVVSIGDVVFGRLKELNAEKEALTGMIMGN
ncbi:MULTISPECIES: CBS domain-containing protein [Paracoccus]|uniref:CBS domain-containing protein n=2 Tax=Paracoccus TaxID=265 RepID=A0A1G9DKH2_9RHOB|nr:CBS domain-containing protein [Paracoccus chinensis]SDK64290.1 CBS domain-containing protein [Paracoccus chinensis]